MTAMIRTALTKTARHAKIIGLLETHEVRSQAELAGLLAGDDVQVTQATLSRDLVEIGAPTGFHPEARIVERATEVAAGSGGSVLITDSAAEVAAGADVLATDTWISMGQENDGAPRLEIFRPYGLDAELLARAADDAIVLHCLPAYRGKEIAAEVIDGPQSVVWDEAENRRHVQKAILAFLDDQARAS